MSTSKLDMTKFFNPELALEQAEKHIKSCTSFIADKTVRDTAETVASASFELVRAQVAAFRAWGDAVQKTWQA